MDVRYYYSPCDSKKWVVLQLSAPVIVLQFKIINAERFSSGPKDFQVRECIVVLSCKHTPQLRLCFSMDCTITFVHCICAT